MLKYKIKRRFHNILPTKLSTFFKERNKKIRGKNYFQKLSSEILSYLEEHEKDVSNKTVLEIGYGGILGMGCEFLDQGFKKVILLDPYTQIRKKWNEKIYSQYPEYFIEEKPNPKYITIVDHPLEYFYKQNFNTIDLIVSTFVVEHIENVENYVKSINLLLKHDGVSINKIDLRDHYFKYPFHMLNFSESEWLKLNPPSNLNRLRYWDYKRLFEKYFKKNQFIINERLPTEYSENKHRLHPDFQIESQFADVATLTIVSRVLIKRTR